MRFRHRTSGNIFSLEDIRYQYENVSFPVVWDDNALNFINCDIVYESANIPVAGPFEKLQYNGVVLINNKWTDVWILVPLFENPIDQLNFINETNTKNLIDKWVKIRQYRNQLLLQTDYIEFLTTPMSDDRRSQFRKYRQDLRDITLQPDPYNLIWPTSP